MKRKLIYRLIALAGIIVLAALAVPATVVSATVIQGTVPLSTYNVNVQNIGDSSATVSWQTNSPGDSQVQYGPTVNYGFTTVLTPAPVTNHTVQLTGLTSNTTYHFRAQSHATISGIPSIAMSNDYTFTTIGSQPVITTTPTSTTTMSTTTTSTTTTPFVTVSNQVTTTSLTQTTTTTPDSGSTRVLIVSIIAVGVVVIGSISYFLLAGRQRRK